MITHSSVKQNACWNTATYHTVSDNAYFQTLQRLIPHKAILHTLRNKVEKQFKAWLQFSVKNCITHTTTNIKNSIHAPTRVIYRDDRLIADAIKGAFHPILKFAKACCEFVSRCALTPCKQRTESISASMKLTYTVNTTSMEQNKD